MAEKGQYFAFPLLVIKKVQMMLREPGSDVSKRVSLYHYDGEDTSYSYISPAELFCIHDPNTDERILMKYDDLEKIVPSSWERIDDKQFAVCPLSGIQGEC